MIANGVRERDDGGGWKGLEVNAGAEQAESGRVRGVEWEEEGLLCSARQCPLNVGRSLEQRVQHAYSCWRTGRRSWGEVKRGLTWARIEKVACAGSGTGGGLGAGRCTYHPSFGRHVSVSRLVNVENRLTDSPPLFCHFRLSRSLLLRSTFLAPPLWSVKLFGRDRRLLISLPRLSSSGLVLTRRHSTHRIHCIRIRGDASNIFREFMRRTTRPVYDALYANELVANGRMKKWPSNESLIAG